MSTENEKRVGLPFGPKKTVKISILPRNSVFFGTIGNP